MLSTPGPQNRVHRYSGLPDLSLGSEASRAPEKEQLIYALRLAMEHLITRDELRAWACGITGSDCVDVSSASVQQIIWKIADCSIRGRDLDYDLIQKYLNELLKINADGCDSPCEPPF